MKQTKRRATKERWEWKSNIIMTVVEEEPGKGTKDIAKIVPENEKQKAEEVQIQVNERVKQVVGYHGGKKRKKQLIDREMSLVHPMFHVSVLKKVVGDPTLIVLVEAIEVNEKLTLRRFRLPFLIGKYEI